MKNKKKKSRKIKSKRSWGTVERERLENEAQLEEEAEEERQRLIDITSRMGTKGS